MTDKIVVVSTVASPDEGQRLARALVERRLAACVNLLPGVRSIYRWQGELCDDGECVLLIKTVSGHFPALRDAIVELHPYDVPEVIALPIADGSAAYLDWIGTSVREPS